VCGELPSRARQELTELDVFCCKPIEYCVVDFIPKLLDSTLGSRCARSSYRGRIPLRLDAGEHCCLSAYFLQGLEYLFIAAKGWLMFILRSFFQANNREFYPFVHSVKHFTSSPFHSNNNNNHENKKVQLCFSIHVRLPQ
jgi:hypothetical protein